MADFGVCYAQKSMHYMKNYYKHVNKGLKNCVIFSVLRDPEEMILPSLKQDGYGVEILFEESNWLRLNISSNAP